MYLSLVFIPLLSSVFVGLLGRFLGVRGSTVFSIFCIGFSFISSCLVFFEVALCESPCYLQLVGWINSGLFDSN
jgi:NADH:ubiquinone oxidoreductase subunit 5 (subunit L)/multisubunit Na+/H+ antiporter MnhA subunit